MRSALISKFTFWPSANPENPARSTALMCTNTSLPTSFGWIKPKPFWPLNHFTVPVGIFFSKEQSRVTITRFQIQLVDVFGKQPAGAFKKAQRLIEQTRRYILLHEITR